MRSRVCEAFFILMTLLLGACSAVPGMGRVGEGDGGGDAGPESAPAVNASAGGQEGVAGNDLKPPSTRERFEEGAGSRGVKGDEAGEASVSLDEGQAVTRGGGVCGGELLVEEERRGDAVLASVDGQEIRASDIYRTFFLENPLRTRNALQNEVLYILTRKESLRLGVTVENEEVEDVLERTIEDHRARCAAYIDETVSLEEYVESQYGMPFADYRSLLRRTAVFKLLLDRCVRFQEMTCERYRLGVIVVDEKEEAEMIRQKILRGANLEVLAGKHSLDRSATKGGILAPIPVDARHPFHPLVESAAQLGEGGVSDVEEIVYLSKTMYRILKLMQVIEPLRGTYREAATAVRESIREDPIDLASIQYWQECLRDSYDIEIKTL